MLRNLLFITICFFSLQVMAQGDCYGCDVNEFDMEVPSKTEETVKPNYSVFPNPAIDFITIKDPSEQIAKIYVYNLVGREIMTFPKSKNDRYNITSLHKGLYLIQLRGADGNILTTQRVNKR